MSHVLTDHTALKQVHREHLRVDQQLVVRIVHVVPGLSKAGLFHAFVLHGSSSHYAFKVRVDH